MYEISKSDELGIKFIEIYQTYVQDITEDLKVVEVNPFTNEMYFAGELGIIYI